MLRILGAPRRVRVVVGGMFVLSAILVSTGVASMAGASSPVPANPQGGYTSQYGYGQDGDHEKSPNPYPTKTSMSPYPTKTSMSPYPTKTSMSPSESESVKPSSPAVVSPTSVTTSATTLPVTGGSSAPIALVGGGLLLCGLTLLGVRLVLTRRT